MKKSVLISGLLFLFCGMIFSQPIPHDSLYFGQIPPGNIPKIFAPGIVSIPDRNEAVITFSPDGKSVFFYIEKWPNPGTPYTMFASYTAYHWTTPDTIPFSAGRSTAEPFFAYNGNRLYMWASDVVNQQGTGDLSYSEKQGNNWSDPISMGNPPNSEAYQYHPCIVGDISVYFSSYAGHVCRSQYSNGVYQSRVILPRPVNYIGTHTWGDPYVSADESFMITKSVRDEGYGLNDIYIAYRKPDGYWTNPKNLGNIINTPNEETSGDITPDGLYMTYNSNGDLYWVGTSFIDSLKYTNFIPYEKNPIPDMEGFTEQFFTYTIPDTTFFDDDTTDLLTLHTALTNGDPLPTWLDFDSITGTFFGTPSAVQVVNIKVTAKDNSGATTSSTFRLRVKLFTATDKLNVFDEGVKIYPNPSGGIVKILFNPFSGKPAAIEIQDLQGRIVQKNTFRKETSIDLSSMPKGMYLVKLKTEDEIFIRKILLE